MYQLDAIKPQAISFAPSNLLEEVTQNLMTIFTTKVNTVPYMRDFGLPDSIIDLPMDQVQMILRLYYLKQVKQYEPRVKITNIKWNFTLDGVLKPLISFELK